MFMSMVGGTSAFLPAWRPWSVAVAVAERSNNDNDLVGGHVDPDLCTALPYCCCLLLTASSSAIDDICPGIVDRMPG